MKTLRETVEIYKGRQAPEVFDEPQSDTQRYLQIEDLRPGASIRYARDADGVLANNGDVIIAWDGANAGTVGFGLAGYIGSTLAILRPKSKDVYAAFLGYFLQTKFGFLRDNTTGATIPHINRDALEELALEFPPLPEQRRIATRLDKADHLRRTRRYAAQLSNTFLQAVFVRMFGDPVRNPMGWDVEYFGDVCETRLGKMLDAKQQTGKHLRPYLRNVNVKWGQIDLTDLQEMDFDEADRQEFRLQAGDVLICEGGEVGRAAVWKNELPECYFQKALHRVRPNPDKTTPEFIVWLMWMLAISGGLVQSVSEVTFAHLTGVRLKELKVPSPPLALQQKFARVVQQFECLRVQQREAERQAEHLFQTLLHKSFA